MKTPVNILAGVAVFALVALTPAAAQKMDSPPGPNQPNQANRLMSGDSNFAMKAAQGGMAEVELGKLAEQRASSQQVKDFGMRMVSDHSKANNELKQIASSKGMTLPTDLDAKDRATMERLEKLSGAEFDRAYMRDMVADHRADINEFKRESTHGTDPDVKTFASNTLPTLEEHLKLAENTEAGLK